MPRCSSLVALTGVRRELLVGTATPKRPSGIGSPPSVGNAGATKLREALSQHMTPDQIAEAHGERVEADGGEVSASHLTGP